MVQWVVKKVLRLVPGVGPVASKFVTLVFVGWKLMRIAPDVWEDAQRFGSESEAWWHDAFRDGTPTHEEIEAYWRDTVDEEGLALAKRAADAYAATKH